MMWPDQIAVGECADPAVGAVADLSAPMQGAFTCSGARCYTLTGGTPDSHDCGPFSLPPLMTVNARAGRMVRSVMFKSASM
jgi:hypothetical protein